MSSFLAVLLVAVSVTGQQQDICSNTTAWLNGTGIMTGKNLKIDAGVTTPEDCCSLCTADYKCGSWSFKNNDTTEKSKTVCYLHAITEFTKIPKSDIVSGISRTKGNSSNTTGPPMACQPGSPSMAYKFCDKTLSTSDRINNLVGMIPTQVKPTLLTARAQQALDFVDVPAYYWGTNCIQSVENGAHGESERCIGDKCSTHFPNPPNIMSAFNRSAIREVANAMATELRAEYNIGLAKGLDCWGPVLNLARDPRWGRNGEAGSEDPYLMSQYSKFYTMGFQNGSETAPNLNGPFFNGIVTLKHWDANTLEDSDNFTRHNFNANVTNFVLQDSYLPAFRSAIVEAGARGIMCAYNSVQGVPSCSSKTLAALLSQWNYEGYTTSDTDAVGDSYNTHMGHGYWANSSQASCKAVTDGKCDINSGSTYTEGLLQGVNESICGMTDVDAAVGRTLKQRFDLGLFDAASEQPLTKLGEDSIATSESAALNLLTAEESLVLLENRDHILPLKSGSTIAVIGPMADDAHPLLGTHFKGYACADKSLDCVPTIFDAISLVNNASKAGSTTTSPGCNINDGTSDQLNAAIAAAKAADTVVLALGIDAGIEHEGHDRVSIDLPTIQHKLAAAVYALKKPTIVVLINGGAISIEPEMDVSHQLNDLAIIEALLPGAVGGTAIANGIFGYHSFGGRLPYSIYPASFVNTTAMSVMDPTVYPGRTYRYHTGDLLYEFGAGLSLSSVSMNIVGTSNLGSITSSGSDMKIVEFAIKNTGTSTVSQVVTAFWSPVSTLVHIPAKKQLFDFTRTLIAPGQTVTVPFTISVKSFYTADTVNGDLIVVPGSYTLQFTDGAGGSVNATIQITGDKFVVEPWPKNM